MSGQLGLFATLAPSVEGIDLAKALATYSADIIAMAGRVRKPAVCGGELWINTGSRGTAASRRAEMYRIIPIVEFDGKPTTYSVKTSVWLEGDEYPGDYARKDPNGFYHGMTVKNGTTTYVLCGPPQQLAVNGLVELLDTTDDEDEYEDTEWSEDDE